MMETTDKQVCRELVSLLVAHGVKKVFVSPGSRNAPIIIAIARCKQLIPTVVIDERCAAFMAVGYASMTGEPVAIVCTSGTALLNYAPAVAEAYYRKLPLIVVSADRPMEWIDQDDSQTLRQPGALSNYVKLSCDIPEITTENLAWYANRCINDALIAACTGRKAPVHINIQLDNPLGNIKACKDGEYRTIRAIKPVETFSQSEVDALAKQLMASPRVMVICGFSQPDQTLQEILCSFAKMPNFVVLTETISNLHGDDFISCIDSTLSVMTPAERDDLAADIVITIGGALVSRFIKEYIREKSPRQHWHLGVSHTTIDCFRALTVRLEADPGILLKAVYEASGAFSAPEGYDYARKWAALSKRAYMAHCAFLKGVPWSDMKAYDIVMHKLPSKYNLQLSNGTPIRYAQLFGDKTFNRSECNRGVSGIDGCTSTAVGAALATKDNVTVLITGDMSAQYDIGALCNARGLANFKIIVFCNGGGGIFRFIKSTSNLDELDAYFAVGPEIPFRELAEGYGLRYFEAHDEKSLNEGLVGWLAEDKHPVLLAVYTPPKESAEILKSYFKRNNQNYKYEKLDYDKEV